MFYNSLTCKNENGQLFHWQSVSCWTGQRILTLAACLAPSSRNTPRFMATRDADRGARETREDVRLREDERAAKQGNWKGVFLWEGATQPNYSPVPGQLGVVCQWLGCHLSLFQVNELQIWFERFRNNTQCCFNILCFFVQLLFITVGTLKGATRTQLLKWRLHYIIA